MIEFCIKEAEYYSTKKTLVAKTLAKIWKKAAKNYGNN